MDAKQARAINKIRKAIDLLSEAGDALNDPEMSSACDDNAENLSEMISEFENQLDAESEDESE